MFSETDPIFLHPVFLVIAGIMLVLIVVAIIGVRHHVGLGFFDSKSGQERYVDYADIIFSYGTMQESFYVESKAASVKRIEYGWQAFTQPDVLRNNLERYGKWS
ncbi:MAG: hypothetical protein LBK55_00625 [Azoarcus sp.]|jgi:hypothetical protein|nr:hypothetical protein [Azoarcus sp.]